MIAYRLYIFHRNVNLHNIFHWDNTRQNYLISYFSVICCISQNECCMNVDLLLYIAAVSQVSYLQFFDLLIALLMYLLPSVFCFFDFLIAPLKCLLPKGGEVISLFPGRKTP